MARPHRPSVSVVLIVKDEEAVLERCLASVAWADEVVVYDTGSRDGTLAIARRLAGTVVEGHWDDDFGAARNRSLEHATREWVLTIDADEVFVGDPAAFRAALAGGAATRTIVQANDRAVALGPVDDGEVMRIFRREGYTWVGAVHEQLTARPGWPAPAAHPIGVARLDHVGYRADVLAAKDKAGRNVALAERDLAEAEAAGHPRAATARFNLVRSLAMAGRRAEALALGERMRGGGDLRDPFVLREVAQLMTDVAALEGEDAVAHRWWEVWVAVAPERAWAHRAAAAADRGDAQAVLDAVAHLPERAPQGRDRASRAELAPLEVWALGRLDRWAEAGDAALRAARSGRLPGHPKDVVLVFRALDRPLDELLAVLDAEAWVSLAVLATQEPAPAANALLEAMAQRRPGDVTVLTCAAQRAGLLTIDEAMRWSAQVRAAGLVDLCPLRSIAATPDLDPRQRAVAAAVAVGAFDDTSVLDDLADALAVVPAEHEAELAELIDAAAPGLLAPRP